ncbi:MAG: hypothetical protein H0U74_01010 [Bradymonadaceae bacterium]|nr:hypothetical protein [Lujinxingiaceae bacterium]
MFLKTAIAPRNGSGSFFVVLIGLLVALTFGCAGDDRKGSNNANNETDARSDQDVNLPGTDDDVAGGDDVDNLDDATSNPNNNTGCQPLSPPIGSACDALCQTGCAVNENCVMGTPPGATAPLTACAPVGPGGQGAACNEGAPCQLGFNCVGPSATELSCHKFCVPGSNDPSQCGTNESCAGFIQDDFRIGICAAIEDGCAMYPNDDCPDNQNCVLTNVGNQCQPYNAAANEGDACTNPTQCNDAQACVGPTIEAATCRNMCVVGGAATCAVGQTCTNIGASFGVCQ